MKKLIFLFTFYMAASMAVQPVYGQDTDSNISKIRDNNAKSVIKEIKEETAKIETLEAQVETLSNAVKNIPDSFLMVVGNDSFYVPIKDGKIIVDTVTEIVNENKDNWPTTLMGWVNLILLIVLGGKATQAFVSAKNIYNTLKPLFKNTLFIVGFVSMGISAGITFLLGSGSFDYTMFTSVSGWVTVIAVFIYEKWIKPKQAETQPKAQA